MTQYTNDLFFFFFQNFGQNNVVETVSAEINGIAVLLLSVYLEGIEILQYQPGGNPLLSVRLLYFVLFRHLMHLSLLARSSYNNTRCWFNQHYCDLNLARWLR
jgi:hypothetical protein